MTLALAHEYFSAHGGAERIAEQSGAHAFLIRDLARAVDGE